MGVGLNLIVDTASYSSQTCILYMCMCAGGACW